MHPAKQRNPLAGIKARKDRDHPALLAAFGTQMHQTEPGMNRPAGQQLFYFLGLAARRVREEAGVRPEQIALKIDHGKEMVDRFERGKTRPQDLEMLLAVYGDLCDLDDSRDIVRDALRLWYQDGEAPTLNPQPEDGDEHDGQPAEPPGDPSLPPDSLDDAEPRNGEEDQNQTG